MEQIDPSLLTLMKDMGMGLVSLLVLGRILFLLVQAAGEFFRGVREDNKERNKHFETLLNVNQAVAQQVELTRLAIEREAACNALQEEAIRASMTAVATLHGEVLKGLGAAQDYLAHELAPLGLKLDEVAQEMGNLHQIRDKLDQIEQQVSQAEQAVLDGLARSAADYLRPRERDETTR